MKRYNHTEVIKLTTQEQVDVFCEFLQAQKSLGPISIEYLVAVTITRNTEFLPEPQNGDLLRVHPGAPLRELAGTIQKLEPEESVAIRPVLAEESK